MPAQPTLHGTEVHRAPHNSDGEQCSSYGTGESEDEVVLENPKNIPWDALLHGLDDIKCHLELMDEKQKSTDKTLASLEQVLLAVQEDMTWVREDLGVVHEVMEKIAEHLSTQNNSMGDGDGLRAQGSPEVSAWGTWRQEPPVRRDETTAITENGRGDAVDEEPSHAYGGDEANSTIRETQMFGTQVGVNATISSLQEEGGLGGWNENREQSPEIFSPRGKQKRRTDVQDADDTGLQETEMTMDVAEVVTQSKGRLMWADFRSVVRGVTGPVFVGGRAVPGPVVVGGRAVPGPLVVGGNTDGGWVRPKRGRGRSTQSSGGGHSATKDVEMTVAGSLNLNLSPESLEVNVGLGGTGRTPTENPTNGVSRGCSRGSGRGTGRVRRPPAVQPRYQSTASAWSSKPPAVLHNMCNMCAWFRRAVEDNAWGGVH